jgi:transposase
LILLENRFQNKDGTATCFLSVDGADCPIMEPWPIEKKWYSEKLNGPGVKYEVGVCIKTGEIVWFKGPFVASKNDATIFIEDLAHRLYKNEGVDVDGGYKGHDALKNKMVSISRAQRKQKSAVRARHETINSRLKQFNVLNFPFRHHKLGSDDMMFKHGILFGAIVVVTHLKMKSGEGTTYDVEYSIGYN